MFQCREHRTRLQKGNLGRHGRSSKETKAKCSSAMGHPEVLHGKTPTLLSGKGIFFLFLKRLLKAVKNVM